MNKEDKNKWVLLLEEHDIRPTSNRITIVRHLGEKQHPLSLKELEEELLTIDKSGIFRTLSLFRDHHLVHAIEGGEGQTLYELCHSHHTHEDDDEHVHFYCQRCHRTFCLFNVPTPHVSLPEGFVRRHMNFVVKGLCADCSRKSGVGIA